jgi:hypothetical protein
MTGLTGVTSLKRFDDEFALTNRLRTAGTDHLLAVRAILAALRGDEARCRELAGRSIELGSRLAGSSMRRARRRTEARSYLRAALDRFETIGAVLWAERARVELRASTGASGR